MSGNENSALQQASGKLLRTEFIAKRFLRLSLEDWRRSVRAAVLNKFSREKFRVWRKTRALSHYQQRWKISARECQQMFPQMIVKASHKGKPFRVCFLYVAWKISALCLGRFFYKIKKTLTRWFFDDAPPDFKNSFDSPELLSMPLIKAVAPRNLLRSARASASSLLSPVSLTLKEN